MKKVLSFLVAGALALGLIGCSGDMHNDVDPATIPASIALAGAPRLSAGGVAGAMQGWSVDTITWTTKDDDNCKYTYDFVANAEEIEWKVVSKKGNWNSGAYGGGANTVTDANVGKTVTLTYDNATGGNKNVKTSGLKVNKVYTITLVYNKGNYDCTVTASDKEKPIPFYLDGYAVSGNMNNWVYGIDNVLSEEKRTVNEQTGYVTYKYDFTANATSVKFGIRSATGNWATKYVGANFVYGTNKDYVVTKKNEGDNSEVTGLTADSKYRMYIQTTPDGVVSYKVVILKKKTVGVSVSNLPDALNGTELCLRGYNAKWDEFSRKGTVTANKLSITFLHYYEEEKLSYKFEGKISINNAWTTQLSGVSDGDGNTKNIEFEFTEDSPIADYVYRGTTGTTNDGNKYYVILPNYTTVVVKLPDTISAKAKVDVKSNICWGGATGKWSKDGETWTDKELKEVAVNKTDKTLTFYVTGNFAASGWAYEQGVTPGYGNLKLFIGDVGANEGLEKDRWFTLDTLHEKNELVWADGIIPPAN